MKWLVLPTQSFSPGKLQKEKEVTLDNLPWIVKLYLKLFKNKVHVILDECFVGDTPVDLFSSTLTTKPIRDIVIGDEIVNAGGKDAVVGTSRKKVKVLVEIECGGKTIACSKNHRWLTVSGWKRAKDLRTGDRLVETAEAMRLVREGVLPKIETGGRNKNISFLLVQLFRKVAYAAKRNTREGVCPGSKKEDCSDCEKMVGFWQSYSRGKSENDYRPLSDERPKECGKDDSNPKEKRDFAQCASCPWREWPTDTTAGFNTPFIFERKLVGGICNLSGKEKKRLSDLLQGGLSPAGKKDLYRGGRCFAQRQTALIGREEGRAVSYIWVERAAVLKQGNPELDSYRDEKGDIYCYDIKAARHSSFSINGVLVHNCSWIKANQPTPEHKKSTRSRVIKLLTDVSESRCGLTGTLLTKSPVNILDPYRFLSKTFFEDESPYEIAETYSIMMSLRSARGRRVLISQKEWYKARKRMINAFKFGGEEQLTNAKGRIHNELGISYDDCEHILTHKSYVPFKNVDRLMKRVESVTMHVSREDIFDITFDKFVYNPITRKVDIGDKAKRLGNELVKLGFTDNVTLGKAASMELMTRLQDICNGFEPIKSEEPDEKGNYKVMYKELPENPKLDSLMELLEEIGLEKNQVVIWCDRRNAFESIELALSSCDISFCSYSGEQSDEEKRKAEEDITDGTARVFLANPASAGFGLNCLKNVHYMCWYCVGASVEKYVQAQHRILRGQSTAAKFAYNIVVRNSVEEKNMTALKAGKELLGAANRREVFSFK